MLLSKIKSKLFKTEKRKTITLTFSVLFFGLSLLFNPIMIIHTSGLLQAQAQQTGDINEYDYNTPLPESIHVIDETQDTVTIIVHGHMYKPVPYENLYFTVSDKQVGSPSLEESVQQNTVSLDPQSSEAVIDYKPTVDMTQYTESPLSEGTVFNTSPVTTIPDDNMLSPHDTIRYTLDKDKFNLDKFSYHLDDQYTNDKVKATVYDVNRVNQEIVERDVDDNISFEDIIYDDSKEIGVLWKIENSE